ncbi:MAG: hypothetical protein QOI51_776 [Nocardioidaceae bacterium]|nr:hypothetical protein [Nocardioidaceae bacterium]
MLHRPFTVINRGGGRRGLWFLAALVAAAGGVFLLVVAVKAQQTAPTPSPSAYGKISARPTVVSPHRPDGTATSSLPTASSPDPQARSPLTLAASRPASITIPAIGLHSGVIAVGKNPDGSLAVPQPGPDLNKVAWYESSPTPGQAGPSVLEGHIDSVYGPSVFFRLAALQPGDKIAVTRTDHTTAVFTVNAVRAYATHDQFPTTEIFGSDLAFPTLRLITCSNFDQTTGHYIGNTVVFAHLTAVRRAGATE